MSSVVIEGKILEWGNSYGIRIAKGDLQREGLTPGEEVTVRIERGGEPVDLSDLPTFAGGRSDVSQRHDEFLARRALEETVEEETGEPEEAD